MKAHYLAALALVAAAPAHALVITPLGVLAEATAETPGGSNSDIDFNAGPSASANESSSYTVTYTGGSTTDTVTAAAFQRDDGFSYIELDVQGDTYSFAGTGELSGYGAEGKTALVLEYRNDGAVAIAPIFNFTLSSVAADTTFAAGDPVEAEFKFDVSTLGGGDSYSASATARSTYNKAEIVNQNNMSGTAVSYECNFGFCFRAAYIFDDIADSILVGMLNPGDIATVVVEMSAKTTFMGTEQGAYARIRDPNGGPAFSYFTTFDNVTGPSPMPLPAPALLLLGGLGGLIGLRRRKRA